MVLFWLWFSFALAIKDSPFDLLPPLQIDASLKYEFGGSALVSTNAIKLTGDGPDQVGYIYSTKDAELPDQFMLDMEISIYGQSKNLNADGMALWFLESDKPTRGGMLGLSEFYKGTCLAIDTYRNGRSGRVFPRLILMQNDGTHKYDLQNDGKANELASCGLRGLYNNRKQTTSTIRIAYSKYEQQLIVLVNFRGEWEPCLTQNIKLGDVKTVAVSAATGQLHEAHVISKLDFTDLSQLSSEESHLKGIKFDRRVTRNNRFAEKVSEQGLLEDYSPEVVKNLMKPRASFARRTFNFFIKLLAGCFVIYILLYSRKRFQRYQQQKEDLFYKLG